MVDRNYQLLSYNKSAVRIFGISNPAAVKNVLAVNRSQEFREAVENAWKGRHTQQRLQMGERIYQVIANAVSDPEDTEDLLGAVILVLDVTEREEQESTAGVYCQCLPRAETPLTSISGIAEIMKNGIVRQEDIPHFAGKVYDESQRLITLIGDIIRLSQLDENEVPLEREQVDMLELARDVVDSLQSVAQQNSILLAVHGTHGVVYGVRRVLHEMVYNLCDNAVKYNRAGGRAWVSVTAEKQTVSVSVRDTGIGIPDAQQSRVFERFYRVDKSHSKAVGGTGLGLSIVKHGAVLHHAEITLHSELEKGTEIILKFPQSSMFDTQNEKN